MRNKKRLVERENKNMSKISLRKVKVLDKKYFAKWWRDKELLKVTSGVLKRITDKEVDKYFSRILKNRKAYHNVILLDREVIGHIALVQRRNGWYETQIVVGEKKQQGKGYGTNAIKLLLQKSKKTGIKKIYLEVRPGNTKAIRAYEKCGFQKIGIKKYLKNKYLSQVVKMVLRYQK